MGGAQPLAVTMNDGVAICVECDRSRIRRRIDHRYLDVEASSIDDALRLAVDARDARRALSIGLLGNAAEIVPALLAQQAPIDIVTDQTSAHDPLSYLPIGVDVDEWHDYAAAKPEEFTGRARESMARHVEAMVGFQDRGAEVFDYGNSIRGEAQLAGYARAFDFPDSSPPTSDRCSARARARSGGRHCRVIPRTSCAPTAPSSTCSPTTSRCAGGSPWRVSGCTTKGCRHASAGWATANATRPAWRSTPGRQRRDLRAHRHRT
jgi:hypothetical protein